MTNGGGNIINVASVSGSIKGIPNRCIYGASKAEEVAGVVLYLASDEGAFCTGQNFIVDGGITI